MSEDTTRLARSEDVFNGALTTYDHTDQAVLSNMIEMRVSPGTVEIVMGDGLDGPRKRIRFDDKKIVWAFTCMVRLMRKQALRRDV